MCVYVQYRVVSSIGSLVQSTLPTSEFSSFVGFDFCLSQVSLFAMAANWRLFFTIYILLQYINPICFPPNSHYEAQMEYYLFDLQCTHVSQHPFHLVSSTLHTHCVLCAVS